MTDHSKETQFDYIIVGGGTAGSVLARRLSERTGKTVLLVERGPRDDHPAILDSHIDRLPKLWEDDRYVREVPLAFDSPPPGGPQTTLQGATLGGGGSVNVMIHLRGNRLDFEEWAARGATGWGWAEMLEKYKAVETFHAPEIDDKDRAFRGTDGLIQVRPCDQTTYGRAFEQAADAHGFKTGWDFNGARQQGGVGPYQFAVDESGLRSGPAQTYLKGAPATLSVLTDRQAARVVLEGDGAKKRATGVVLIDPATRAETTYRARAEVIIACGAYESPKLLMLSGIGDGGELAARGIEVEIDLPSVGKRLQDHVITSVFYDGKKPLPELEFFTEIGLFTHMLKGESGAFDADAWPNLQMFMNSGVASRRWEGQSETFLGFYPSLSRPKSMGTVGLASSDPLSEPVVHHRHLSEDEDVDVLANGFRLAQKLAATEPLNSEFIKGPTMIMPGAGPIPYIAPDADLRGSSFDEYRAFVKLYSRGLWHPAGSCCMGAPGHKDTVVDPDMRVVGVSNLRVCDASIMPTLVCGNPNATVMAMAERGAELIAG